MARLAVRALALVVRAAVPRRVVAVLVVEGAPRGLPRGRVPVHRDGLDGGQAGEAAAQAALRGGVRVVEVAGGALPLLLAGGGRPRRDALGVLVGWKWQPCGKKKLCVAVQWEVSSV